MNETPCPFCGQIHGTACTPAVLSPEPPIVPTSGTKRVPDDSEVVQDAQLVRMSVLGCEGCPHSSTCGVFNIRGGDDWPCIAALERLEAERDALLVTVTAAYFLLNSDQCTHGGDDWNDPECRVCNLRRAFDALPHDVRDRLASMTYAERVIRG